MQHVRSSLSVSATGIAPSGTVYVGAAGFAYMFWHLARHVDHGSPRIPRHVVILRPRGSQKSNTQDTKRNSPVTAEELYRLALTICDTAIGATSHFPGRCTFLEGYAGPLALRCAILSGLSRHQVLPLHRVCPHHLCAHACLCTGLHLVLQQPSRHVAVLAVHPIHAT